MKNAYLFSAILFLAFSMSAEAQIGIGTKTPDPSAKLDISSNNKGVLFPRVALTGINDITTIPHPASSLLVYNTATTKGGSTAVTPGFYYWNDKSWVLMSGTNSVDASSWLLTGNAGTDPAVNFVGTTDDKPLVFRVNNIVSGKISTNDDNSLWGFQALYLNTTGIDNTANGRATLYSNTTGSFNTASGRTALYTNTTGNYNTATGYVALFNNTKGDYNTATGANALVNNITGSYNTADGWDALYSNTTGIYNTAMGDSALFSNTTGAFNTAAGRYALAFNKTGISNTANGANALYFNTGSNNTAMGRDVLYNNKKGSNNTAYGMNALFTNTKGSNNTALGYGADVSSGTLTNATAIGCGAIVNASNKVRIGNAAVTVIEGQVLPTTPSDGRFKFNVREDVHGLDFILKLRPVSYQFDVTKMDEQMSGRPVSNTDAIQASYQEAITIRRTGFIAQEVEKAAEMIGYNFTGVNKPASDKDHYSLSYEAFVMPLVKAVQEQQEQLDKLNKENETLKEKLLSQNTESKELKETITNMQAAFTAQQNLVSQQLKQLQAAITTQATKEQVAIK